MNSVNVTPMKGDARRERAAKMAYQSAARRDDSHAASLVLQQYQVPARTAKQWQEEVNQEQAERADIQSYPATGADLWAKPWGYQPVNTVDVVLCSAKRAMATNKYAALAETSDAALEEYTGALLATYRTGDELFGGGVYQASPETYALSSQLGIVLETTTAFYEAVHRLDRRQHTAAGQRIREFLTAARDYQVERVEAQRAERTERAAKRAKATARGAKELPGLIALLRDLEASGAAHNVGVMSYDRLAYALEGHLTALEAAPQSEAA